MAQSNWTEMITDTMRAEVIISALKSLWEEVASFLPNLFGALVLLILGFLIAKAFQKVGSTLLKRLKMDSAAERVGLSETLRRAGLTATASDVVGRIFFWVVFLTFLIPATETLGLERVSETIDALVSYLPNVIGAALILVVGLVIAYFVRNLVRGGAESIHFDHAEAVAKLSYGVMIILVTTLAIGQLKLETDLIKRVVEITLIAIGTAFAIGLGLGSRDLARHVLAGFYARESFPQGAVVSVGDDEGEIEVVGTVSTRIKSADGKIVHVPNGQLTDSVVHSRT